MQFFVESTKKRDIAAAFVRAIVAFQIGNFAGMQIEC